MKRTSACSVLTLPAPSVAVITTRCEPSAGSIRQTPERRARTGRPSTVTSSERMPSGSLATGRTDSGAASTVAPSARSSVPPTASFGPSVSAAAGAAVSAKMIAASALLSSTAPDCPHGIGPKQGPAAR